MSAMTRYRQSLKLYQCDACKSEGQQNEAEYKCKHCEENLCSSCRDVHKKFQKLRDHEVQQLSSNPPVCTTCKSGDIVREASCFCKNCDEFLCNACKSDHKKFKKLRGHVIVDVKEPGQNEDKSKHTGPSLADSKLQTSGPETSGLQTPPSDVSRNDRGLHASAPATESHLSAKSEDSPMSTGPSWPFNILNMSLKAFNIVNMKVSDDDSVRIGSCVFMPSGELLLADIYEGGEVLHLDSSFTIREKLKLRTFQISVLSENVAVVVADGKLQFLEVTPKLRIIKSIPLYLGWDTTTITVGGGLIYISCFKEEEGHIKVLNSSGKEIRRINVFQNGQALFDEPTHLAASKTRVFISGEALTCLKSDGTLVYHYKDEKLGKISGMVVDSEDNVVACAYGNKDKAEDTFHMITANGKRHISKALEQSIKIPGYSGSDCIAFRPSDRTLVMGRFSELYIFKTA